MAGRLIDSRNRLRRSLGLGTLDPGLDGPRLRLTPPIPGQFSWVNQGGASVATQEDGTLYLSAPAGAGINWRIREITAPSTPWTITAWLMPLLPRAAAGEYPSVGLCFRESGTGRLHTFHLYHSGDSGNLVLNDAKFTDASTFSADYVNNVQGGLSILGPAVCLRVADDGTNRICSWSTDGDNFVQFSSIGRTDFLTANRVGWGVCAWNGTYAAGARLLSWAQG